MKVLFCSDGSAAAEEAVRFGALIAAGCHAETTILGIYEQDGTEDALVRSLRRSQELLKEHDLNAELITKAGQPVTEILKRTQGQSYDLVVIGAERRPGRTPALRSVKACQIIEAVAPPVLVVLGHRPALRRILLCSSGGAHAGKAVELTGMIASGPKAEVTSSTCCPPRRRCSLRCCSRRKTWTDCCTRTPLWAAACATNRRR